ncbi:ZIP family metal transporter [Asaccharospora irregularis]|uniref:Zinc transporter, ZIP family n=1 Tax=Asaccharospora irregularis DSM 2635 TaxID=1121321 RepID=A0A1M5S816_9FIRM|nr:ZIP family metal transporter [Asaccharospora irregularis]SHH34757.1 zinc transporter, ZIP family [Asaccharospora irregularis DSM 2635]
MILKVTIIGLLAGIIGTGLGGIISVIFKKEVDKYLNLFMGLSGGIMLAVVVFDLMKESMNNMGVINTVIFTFLGVLITMYIKSKMNLSGDMRFGYLIFISILLHNLPEGLAIGSSFMSTEKLGITLAIVIGLHNIPEGLAMALGLICSKMKVSKVILLTIVAGIPMGIGSFFGVYFGSLFSSLIGVFLATAAGTMMYVVLEEIFPKSRSIYCIIGFLLGTLIVNYI